MQEMIDTAQEYCLRYGMNVIAAIIIFIIGRFLAGIAARLVEQILNKAKVDKTLSTFIRHLTYMGMMVIVIVAAVNKIGVETTSIVAMIGAAGLAVGLALQGSLANFAAGVVLILLKPFKVGDTVDIEGVIGTIQEVQIFNTVLTSPDNRLMIYPNSKITGSIIVNLSGIDKRRIDLKFGISYSDDFEKAKKILLDIVCADKRVLTDPAPVVRVIELADSSVNIVCRPWVRPIQYWDVYFDIIEKGKVALEKNGITIPFPQRDIHVYQETKK